MHLPAPRQIRALRLLPQRRRGDRLQIKTESLPGLGAGVGDSNPGSGQQRQGGRRGAEVASSRRLGWITTTAEDRGDMRRKSGAGAMLEVGHSHRREFTIWKDTRLWSWGTASRPRANWPCGKDLVGLQMGLSWEVGHSWEKGVVLLVKPYDGKAGLRPRILKRPEPGDVLARLV